MVRSYLWQKVLFLLIKLIIFLRISCNMKLCSPWQAEGEISPPQKAELTGEVRAGVIKKQTNKQKNAFEKKLNVVSGWGGTQVSLASGAARLVGSKAGDERSEVGSTWRTERPLVFPASSCRGFPVLAPRPGCHSGAMVGWELSRQLWLALRGTYRTLGWPERRKQ